ncbi:hypothetical protein HD806DRAFT_228008 [Xylariaceae sp. AK1471]|nr:hypothetical protein HD806DRAFT_228008 [Xylariaceae sp. AK1471]
MISVFVALLLLLVHKQALARECHDSRPQKRAINFGRTATGLQVDIPNLEKRSTTVFDEANSACYITMDQFEHCAPPGQEYRARMSISTSPTTLAIIPDLFDISTSGDGIFTLKHGEKETGLAVYAEYDDELKEYGILSLLFPALAKILLPYAICSCILPKHPKNEPI